MDDESKLPEVDVRIRAALIVDGVASRRVVMRALADDGRRVKEVRRRPFVVVTSAVLALLLVMSAWQWRRGARVPVSAPSLSITGEGSLLIVDGQDGRRWVVGPPPQRRTGGNYVIVVRE
jgi:hypothetical protein